MFVEGEKGASTIDTSHPLNAAYLKERKLAKNSKAEMQQLLARIPKNPLAPAAKPSKINKRMLADDGDEDDDMPPPSNFEVSNTMLGIDGYPAFKPGLDSVTDLQLMRLKGEAYWAVTKAEKEKMLLDKVAGKLIPIDLVQGVFERFMKGVRDAYESGLDNLANTYCLILAGGDITKYTEIMEAIRAHLDKCLKENGDVVIEDIGRIIDNYMDTKRL